MRERKASERYIDYIDPTAAFHSTNHQTRTPSIQQPIPSLPTNQPLYGFLSDGFPLFGYRRRSYLALSGVLGALSWLALASPGLVSTTAAATLACTLSSLSVAVSDVVADSIVVEKIRAKGDADPKLAGGLQSLCWGAWGF